MNAPGITVVICTYNRAGVLRLALDALLAQDTRGDFSFEICVVDDASTDDTAKVIEAAGAQGGAPVRAVAGEGRGVAAARNAGVRAARGAWVAFTDDDQVNEPDWLWQLHALAGRTGAICVGGQVALRLEGQPPFPLTPVLQAILGRKHHAECRIGRLMDCPGTGNVMFAREVFERVGMFNEALAWGGEDADFMLRVMNAGIAVWFTPASLVHHLIPPYRLTEDYFRWASLRVGIALAEVDARVRGKIALAARCAARIGQAVLLTLPRMVFARLRGERGALVEQRCLWWRAGAYVRQTLRLLAPRVFRQTAYFERLAFRAERSTLGAASSGTSAR